MIRLRDLLSGQDVRNLNVRWGRSVFGKRQIISLLWSPDGFHLAFTVSKPPIPDDEIFVVNASSGKISQLPYRTGRAAWDWGR